MGLSRRIEDLDPRIREKAIAFLDSLVATGIAVAIVETRRSQAVQEAYYAQGREDLETVNALRRAAGLGKLTETDNRRPVTWTKQSKHLQGLALDVAPLHAYYTIRPGDTLARIAERFELNLKGLLAFNSGVEPTRLKVGQRIKLPLCPEPGDDGGIWWTAPFALWERIGEIGEKCGLRWGGRWKGRVDTPHFEL